MTKDYDSIAREVRKDVLSLIHKGQTSHIASNFSLADIGTVLYENLGPNDVACWSKGWAAALHYILEIRRGNLDRETVFNTFPNEPYLGLLEPSVPTVQGAGGSMGQLLGISIGMAMARKREGKPGTIYCIMSDGEMQEGTTWEGAQLAGQHKLDNLVVLIDYNKWTAMGRTEDVADVEPFGEKWAAFKWQYYLANGHNYGELHEVITEKNGYGEWNGPLVIICDTVKGKGVEMFEDKILYHYAQIDEETYEKALAELN